MAENLFCEEQDCGQPAQAFGFVNGVKWRTCETHSVALVRKNVTVYNIAASALIQTPKDGPFYEDRRILMQRGFGSVAALESRCEDNWQEGQRRIAEASDSLHEVVRQSMQEIRQRSEQRYEETKKALGQLRSRFERLTQYKDFQLSPADMEICDSVTAGPVFCLMLGDSRLPVVEALLANFHVLTWDIGVKRRQDWAGQLATFAQDQANRKNGKCAAEAAEYAKRLGVDGPSYAEEAHQYIQTLTQRLSELLSNKHYQAEECLKAGRDASKIGEFDQALEKLQGCVDLLGDMKDSELYSRVRSTLAETYYQAGRWANTVTLCEEIFRSWNHSPHNFEFLRCLYFLSNSHYWLNQDSQGFAAVAKWGGKLTEDSAPCQCLLQCIQANQLRLQGKPEAAKLLYEQALLLDESVAYITTCCKGYLAEVQRSLCHLQEAEKAYLEARQLFSVHFPGSQGYASCLLSLGTLYQSMKKPQTAEEQHLRAVELYSHFASTHSQAKSLTSLGLLYRDKKQPENAIQLYLQASFIYSTHFPKSLDYAICLSALGSLYTELNRTNEGEGAYQQAVGLCSTHFPQSRVYADCLYGMGVLCEKKGQKSAAVQKYEGARKIYMAASDIGDCDSALRRLNSRK